MKKLLLALFCFGISFYLFAQENTNAEPPATGLRADNKIYVVIAVLVTILAGLFIYIIRLDRKITKLEQNNLI
jgi:hypothetical protein